MNKTKHMFWDAYISGIATVVAVLSFVAGGQALNNKLSFPGGFMIGFGLATSYIVYKNIKYYRKIKEA